MRETLRVESRFPFRLTLMNGKEMSSSCVAGKMIVRGNSFEDVV